MAALSGFARYVRSEVPMCPEILILDAVLHAGIEFCKRTKIMQETLDLTTVIDQQAYDLTELMLEGTEPDEVIAVRRDSISNLDPTSKEDELWDGSDNQTGSARRFYLEGNNLVLSRIPDEVETFSVVIKARPSEAATTLPDELYARYRTEIAAGAKSRLMMMTAQEWTNLDAASINKMIFDGAINTENLRYAKGGGSKPLRTVINSF
jgi:hypothetical protein